MRSAFTAYRGRTFFRADGASFQLDRRLKSGYYPGEEGKSAREAKISA